MNDLLTIAEANALIDQGRVLHIAGVEEALSQLHRGNWIGGTTPYMLTRQGGVIEQQRVMVTELPVEAERVAIHFIDIGHIPAISIEAPRNGFTIVIVPSMSEIHAAYSLTSARIPGIRDIALIGWVAGALVEDHSTKRAKVFNGFTGESDGERIVVMHAALPSGKNAHVDIVNLNQLSDGDEIVFDAPSFSVRECTINGKREDFYAYAKRNNLTIHSSLVTVMNGENIAVSLNTVDDDTRAVLFFAPVMKDRIYRLAQKVPDYRTTLLRVVEERKLDPVLAVNCYHNFAFGGLLVEAPYPLPGAVVFGELAHVLMNQTLVCLSITDK